MQTYHEQKRFLQFFKQNDIELKEKARLNSLLFLYNRHQDLKYTDDDKSW